jgi:hypothetical protein
MRAFPKPHALLAAAAEPGFIGIHLGRMLHLFGVFPAGLPEYRMTIP